MKRVPRASTVAISMRLISPPDRLALISRSIYSRDVYKRQDAEGAALLQYLRALSPGVRIYADGTLELEQPEL